VAALASLRRGISTSNAARIRELYLEQRQDLLLGKPFPRLTKLHYSNWLVFTRDIVILRPAAADTATVFTSHSTDPRATIISLGSTLEALTCLLDDGLLTCLSAPEQPLRRLRYLCVHRHRDHSLPVAARLLDALAAPNSACLALKTLRFEDIFHLHRGGAGQAFRRFACCPALTTLCITNHDYYEVTPVPHADVAAVWVAPTRAEGDGTAVASCHERRFAPLEALEISIEPASMATLVRMFPMLTRLSVKVSQAESVVAMPANFFAAIGRLTALRSLDFRPSYGALVTAADVRALQRLAQLRRLTLRTCRSAPDLAAADVLQLFRSFRHAQTIQVRLNWSPPPETLALLGTACPQLRTLKMWCVFDLATALDTVERQAKQLGQPPMPFFANLVNLRIRRFDYQGGEAESAR
jgi:hypothetical protein